MNTHNLSTKRQLRWIALVLMCALSAERAPAQQQLEDTYWTNSRFGNWFIPGNWSNGMPVDYKLDAVIDNGGTAFIGAPGAFARDLSVGGLLDGGSLIISNGGTLLNYGRAYIGEPTPTFVPASVTVNGNGSDWAVSFSIWIETGTLTIENGGSVFTPLGIISNAHGTRGSVFVTGAGSRWEMSPGPQVDLLVGGLGSGSLMISNGGMVSNAAAVIGGGSTGTTTVSGAGSRWTSNGDLTVGNFGAGALNVTAGGVVSNTNGYIGKSVGAMGTATINGANSTWANSGNLFLGHTGSGTLAITAGGVVSSLTGNLGFNPGATGAATINGANSAWANSSDLSVGYFGTGALSITGGGVVSNRHGFIGRHDNSTGTATGVGANSRWTNSGDLNVGLFAAGELNITGGGRVSSDNGYIGSAASASGAVTIDGAGSVWTNANELTVGSSGDGALNIIGGAVVESTIGSIGRYPGSTGAVLIDGPGSRWNASNQFTMGGNVGLFLVPTAMLEVRNGGVLSAAHGINAGQYSVARGDGTIAADLSTSGYVLPGRSTGDSTGTLRVTGNYEQYLGAILQIELASNTSFDKLAVTGNLSLPSGSIAGSGSLQLSLIGGYAPNGSQSFDILDWGSRSGTFDSLLLPTLGGTLAWDTSQLYTTGVLSVVGPAAPFLEADFDENGVVNGADLTRWRNGFKTGATHMQGNADGDGDVDGGDLLVWQRQLGARAIAASAAVPEPWSLGLVLASVCLLFAVKRGGQFGSRAGSCHSSSRKGFVI